MTTQILNIETVTKSEIIIASTLQPELMDFLGGVVMIKQRSIETLRSLLNMYFILNTEAGAFYNKKGF